jgi:hypothetical protein
VVARFEAASSATPKKKMTAADLLSRPEISWAVLGDLMPGTPELSAEVTTDMSPSTLPDDAAHEKVETRHWIVQWRVSRFRFYINTECCSLRRPVTEVWSYNVRTSVGAGFAFRYVVQLWMAGSNCFVADTESLC